MLKNDEIFWAPTETSNAARKSWRGSGGDPSRLWESSVTRWQVIRRRLARAGVRPPAGRIVEFGAGLGLLDDLLDGSCSSILMLDHTDAYIRDRTTPLSPRCRHVLWSQESLDALQAEPASYGWVISLAVFWHVDDATAAALVRELGKLLKPGGHVLVHGWNPATVEKVREMSTRRRLFDRYPTYVLNPDLLRKTLAPTYQEVCRDTVLLYRKDRAQEVKPRLSLRTVAARFLRPQRSRR
jgi:2-polyprenyl-3-methyl-5-hydroxy-6-metoxy-1,4-benzoquinol methylase